MRLRTERTSAPADLSGGAASKPLVALIGNPNTGKTSVFNMLTGARHRVGNYPGVTVEKMTGQVSGATRPIELLDLPGTYSLAARSPDEMIVSDALLGRLDDISRIAAAVIVVDASNLDRNLFLATQVLETGVPGVVALNMIDVAGGNGIHIEVGRLSERLGVPVIRTQARKGEGRVELIAAIEAAIDAPCNPARLAWPKVLEDEAASLEAAIAGRLGREACPPRTEVRRCLLDVNGYAESRLTSRCGAEFDGILTEHRGRLADLGMSSPGLEAELRYQWIGGLTEGCVTRDGPDRRTRSDRIDDVLTHRILGSLIFVLVMGSIFVSVFSWAAPLMDGIDGAFGWLAALIRGQLGRGVLASFLADGIVAGVGGVLVFLPQILILFGLITVLEDCGYLARAAFLVDRVLRLYGLSGRSFVPLLSSFACAIPGVLAARTIENRRDRIATIMVAPLMACSARIPIYTILVAAFVPAKMLAGFLPLQGLVFASMYFFGIAVAGGVALALKKTVLRGEESPFLLELPSYKLPAVWTVLLRTYDRGKDFVMTAGTIILAMSVVIWALLYFPRPAAVAEQVRTEMNRAGQSDESVIEKAVAGAYLRQSVLGHLGRTIEPVVAPLGWDWKIGMATLAAFPAREVVISTMGIIYNLGPDENEASEALRDKLRAATWPGGGKVYTLPVALSIMAFFALCCQCQATVAVIKRETNSWRWPIFAFCYLTVLAYVAALLVYQVGSRLA